MTLVDAALDLPVVGSYAGPAFRAAVLGTPLSRAYWRVAPAVHRRRRYASPGYVDPPVDPFALVLVDPARITRFTGREFPVWADRWSDFGRLLGGDWDRRERPPVDPSYAGPDPSLYLADRFDETPVYRALEAHFVDGVPWEETAFVRGVVEQARADGSDRPVWQHCSTVEEVRRHCRNLDRLYEDMRERGCLSMRELNRREEERLNLRKVMKNEILVDVGRDGEPLFVTGRHRLSVAKILGVERVPVAVVVRHAEWERRRRARSAGAEGRRTEPEHDVGEPLDVAW